MEPVLILFDVDGTLVDAAGAGRRAMGEAFRRVFAIDGFEDRTARVHYAGSTDPRIIRDLGRALGVPAGVLEGARHELHEAYYDALEREMSRRAPVKRVLPGVRELLEELDRRGEVVLGLMTGNFERGARSKLAPFGLNRFFPDGGFSSDHADRREIARVARRKLSVLSGHEFPPARVAVVGDTVADVECARANGFRAVAVCSGWAGREELAACGPDVLLESLEDVAGALRALGLRPAGA